MPYPKKPKALHDRDGTFRPDRQNAAEPAYRVAAPKKPRIVAARPAASKEWTRITKLLLSQRVLSEADLCAVTGYCAAWADLVDAEQVKADTGYRPILVDVSVDGAGVEHIRHRAHPILAASVKASVELRPWAQQLGLTPASRARVSSAPEQPASALAQFVAKRAG